VGAQFIFFSLRVLTLEMPIGMWAVVFDSYPLHQVV
jgi:hypothetical protein